MNWLLAFQRIERDHFTFYCIYSPSLCGARHSMRHLLLDWWLCVRNSLRMRFARRNFFIELNENEMISFHFYFLLISQNTQRNVSFVAYDTSCELEGAITKPEFSIKFWVLSEFICLDSFEAKETMVRLQRINHGRYSLFESIWIISYREFRFARI